MNTYINLPVADLSRSRRFFEALGFAFNDQFSDETALAAWKSAQVRSPCC